MRAAVIVLLALTDCGRFGYDPAGAGGDGGVAIDGAPSPVSWWDDSWPYRRRVFVHNGGGARLDYGFQAVLTYDLDTLAEVPSGHDTMYLVHQDDFDTDPPYVMTRATYDLPGDPEEMWFRLEEPLPAGETVAHYYLYYGRANPAPPPKDPAQIFDYYAELAGPDASLVGLTGGEQTTADHLVLDPGESVRTDLRFDVGTAVDIQLDMPTWTAPVWLGFHQTSNFDDTEPWMMWATRGDTGLIQSEVLSTLAGVPQVLAGTPVAAGAAEHTYTVARFGAKVIFARDGAETERVVLPTPFGTRLQVRLHNGGSVPVSFDLIRVRVAADPMPEVTLGGEETRP